MKNLTIIILLFTSLTLSAKEKCPVDFKGNEIPQELVIDYANVIDDKTERKLKQTLERFSNETSNQILVLTVNDLCGLDPANYSNRIMYNWGVGQADLQNGIVVLIKPFGTKGTRHTFIAVGPGLQGAIPDAISKRIVEVEMIPLFREEQFEAGIINGTTALMGLAEGEISTNKYAVKPVSGKSVLFGLFILFIAFLILLRNVRRIRKSTIGGELPFWTAFWLMSNSGHRRHSSWNDFHSGGGSFGGGFGGFGGGSANGGGAGGSW